MLPIPASSTHVFLMIMSAFVSLACPAMRRIVALPGPSQILVWSVWNRNNRVGQTGMRFAHLRGWNAAYKRISRRRCRRADFCASTSSGACESYSFAGFRSLLVANPRKFPLNQSRFRHAEHETPSVQAKIHTSALNRPLTRRKAGADGFDVLRRTKKQAFGGSLSS